MWGKSNLNARAAHLQCINIRTMETEILWDVHCDQWIGVMEMSYAIPEHEDEELCRMIETAANFWGTFSMGWYSPLDLTVGLYPCQ